jgi:hypothetical protein
MTTATYAPRVPVHPDRMGAVKTSGPNLWAILHTSEGGEGVDSAEQLASFLERPGDRPNDSGGQYGASYHVVFDTGRRVIPAVRYDVVAYSAAGANAQGIHGCFPGKARQTRAEWLDPISREYIESCAAWLVDIEAEFGIPIDRVLFPGEMLAGDKGLGDHFTVTQAFGKTNHTDVGPGFPWDVLFADIAALTAPLPEEDDDMKPYIAIPPVEFNGKELMFVSSMIRPANSFDVADGYEQRKMQDIKGRNEVSGKLYRVEQYEAMYMAAGLGVPKPTGIK